MFKPRAQESGLGQKLDLGDSLYLKLWRGIQGQLHVTRGHATCAVTKGPCLVSNSAVSVLKFIFVEQRTPHFHFALGPTNYVVCPG